MEQKEFCNGLDWAVRAGVTDGTDPQRLVTREEATEMIRCALECFFGRMIETLEGGYFTTTNFGEKTGL